MLRPFALHRPATAAEACALLADFGDDGAAYAGGTELLLLMKVGLLRPRHLVDVKRIAGFDAIADGDALTIGATVTHRTVERAPAVRARCPLLANAARHVANVRVRNVGTIGGNLAFADPHSDLATVLLALDASVELVSPRGRRRLPLADFTVGPWDTARAADELLAAVHVPAQPPGASAYVKFGLHERPTLGVAVVLHLDGHRVRQARVALGCVNPRPVRLGAVEQRLAGVSVDALGDVAAGVADLAAEGAEPDDDLHGSAEYKREMVAVFTRRALDIAAARAQGVEPAARWPHAVVA